MSLFRSVLTVFILLALCTPSYARRIESDERIAYAVKYIQENYGDKVSLTRKHKTLLKFGRNDDLSTTEEMVWLQGDIETLPSTNAIDKFSSSDAGDSQDIVVEGHTISGSDLTFVAQTVTLNGQTETSLTTPLARATRLYNADNTDFSGTVYVYEDDTVTNGVPQTAAKIHLKTDGSNNQSLKAATSISSQDYWIITQVCGSVNRQQTRSVDFRFKVKESGGVFRTRLPFSVNSSGGTSCIDLDPYFIVKPNSDVRMTAISSGASTGVGTTINGYLAIKE